MCSPVCARLPSSHAHFCRVCFAGARTAPPAGAVAPRSSHHRRGLVYRRPRRQSSAHTAAQQRSLTAAATTTLRMRASDALWCVCVSPTVPLYARTCRPQPSRRRPTALLSHGCATRRCILDRLRARARARAHQRVLPQPRRDAFTRTRACGRVCGVRLGTGMSARFRVCVIRSHMCVCVCDEVGTCWCATAALARAGGGSSGVPRWSRPRQRRAHRPRHMRTYVCTCVWVCVGGRPRMCACACACAWADPLLKCPGSHVARYLAHLPTVAHACVRARTTDKRKEYACP